MVLMLCSEILGTASYTHIVEPEREVPTESLPELEAALRRLGAGEPIQYVLGFAEFCGLRFKVSPAVLIPRPETELLVKEAVTAALASGPRPRVLDLCTGSGCIAWSIFKEVPQSSVVAVDISEDALALASDQFSGDGPIFLKADVLDAESTLECGQFDILVSNPPYVMEKEKALMRPNVLDYEPSLALFVPDNDPLLFYRAIAVWSARCLVPGGTGIVEINEALGEETCAVFRSAGFKEVSAIEDFYGKNRFVRYKKAAA